MSRARRWSWGGGQSFISEVPLYLVLRMPERNLSAVDNCARLVNFRASAAVHLQRPLADSEFHVVQGLLEIKHTRRPYEGPMLLGTELL